MFVWFHPIHKEYKLGDRQSFFEDVNQNQGKAELTILYELTEIVMPLADKIIRQLHGDKFLRSTEIAL